MYERNKDLVLVTFFGFIYYAIVIGLNGHLTRVPLGEYFMIPFAISIFMGMTIGRASQMIEWPICFLFGGTVGSMAILAVLSMLGRAFTFYSLAFTISNTFAWFGVVSAMILIGIMLGAFFKATYILILGSLKISFD